MSFFLLRSSLDELVTYENCEEGRSVTRGRDWRFADADHYNGVPGEGSITGCEEDQMANVTWKNGESRQYRIGNENAYDLRYLGGNVISFICVLFFYPCTLYVELLSLVSDFQIILLIYYRL